jgi:hypothetical protein
MVDTAEKWGSPEFHERRPIRQEEERQQQQEVKDPQELRELEAVVHRTRGLDTTPEQRQRLREEAQAESDTAWGEWFDRRFHQRLSEYMKAYSETVVKVTFERLEKHKRALETEILELRNELNVLREVRAGNVTELVRKPDVA